MTNEEFIAAWRAGKTVRVIEMGGGNLGEGYERCIWEGAVAVLADLMRRKPNISKGDAVSDAEHQAMNRVLRASPASNQMSGAQAGAAKNIAMAFYVHGYEGALALAPSRVIELSASAQQ